LIGKIILKIIDVIYLPAPLVKYAGYSEIKSICFDYNVYNLDREAKIELEKLYMIMERNPSLYVEIIGHTDSKGSDSYNMILSEKRARAATNYLITKGINKERFVARGVGENEHIAVNVNKDGTDNPEGRRYKRHSHSRFAPLYAIRNQDGPQAGG